MAFQVCKRCGKMFEKNGKLYCKGCTEKNEKDFDLILNHIKQNPKATVMDIITETSVSLKSIDCFVEEGGIVYVENKPSEEYDDENPKVDKISSSRGGRFHLRR